MSTENNLPFPVKLTLSKNGYVLSERIAQTETDLYCHIEMDTGMGRLDAAELYQKLLSKQVDEQSEFFKVCHSYEKWGAMQQEVVKIKVTLQRIAEFKSASIECLGVFFWLGILFNACWLIAYGGELI